jgi:predicted nucleotidyltransferase
MNFEEIKHKIRPIFEKDKDVLFGYIFGSQVTEKTDFESDVDIAVFFDEKRVKDIFKKHLFLIEKIQGILRKQIEVVVLNEIKSIFFKFVIVKEGKVIFERNHLKRVEFELNTLQEYFDFKPFIEKYDEAFIKQYS